MPGTPSSIGGKDRTTIPAGTTDHRAGCIARPPCERPRRPGTGNGTPARDTPAWVHRARPTGLAGAIEERGPAATTSRAASPGCPPTA
nr:hypothetical protein [Candidatus Sigynarchaeum springense]